MSEIWAAAIAAAGTAYGIYAQQSAIGAANDVRPRPFVPIDINKTAQLMRAADIAGYENSQRDFERRFPLLQKGKEYNISDAASNLDGKTSATVTNAMDKAGLSADISGTEFQKSQALGKPILAMEQRDRNYFSNLLAQNPQKAAGMNSSQYGQLIAQNTGAQNAYNSQFFGNQINRYNANIAQGMQNQYAATSGLASLASLFGNNNRNQQSGYLEPGYYGHSLGGSYGGLGYNGGVFNSTGRG